MAHTSTAELGLVEGIKRSPEVKEQKKSTVEDIRYFAEDVLYESKKRLPRKDEKGEVIRGIHGPVLESEAATIGRAIEKFVKHEDDGELRAVAETIFGSGLIYDMSRLSDLTREQKRTLARSGACFNHRVGSLLEQIGDRVPLNQVASWLGEYTKDMPWGRNIVNGAAGELGMLDTIRTAIARGMLSASSAEGGHIEQDIEGGDIIIRVPNRKGFEEIVVVDVKCYKDPIPEEIFVDMDNTPDRRSGRIRGERTIPVTIDTNHRVVEEQFARRVKVAISPESLIQNPDGTIALRPNYIYEQLEGIAEVCDEVAARTRNSTRRVPRNRHN